MTPPRLLLAALLLLVLPGAARAGALAFVINSGSASVSLIDVDTRTELKRIPMLREPHHMALSPDGRSLLIGDAGANVMMFLDPRTGDLQRQMTISDPYQMVFSPDGRTMSVAALARNQIDIYDANSFQLLHRIAAPKTPSHLNYSPDSSVVYVSLQNSNELIAIGAQTGQVVWKKPVGKAPAGVMWHRGKLLVGIMGADYVAVVDPATGAVTQKIVTGRGAHVLFASPDGRLLYVSNRVDGTITVLDAATLQEIRRYSVPGGPDDMDFAADGKIWISQRWQRKVVVLDPATGAMQAIEVGRSPHGIWINKTVGAAARPRAAAGR